MPTFITTGTGLAVFMGIVVAWLMDIASTQLLVPYADVKMTTVILLGVGCFCTIIAQQAMIMCYRKYCRACTEGRETAVPRFPMPGQTKLPTAHEIPPGTHRMP